MTARALFVTLVIFALATPLFAGDIILMPTANTVAGGDVELNAIYQKMAPSGSDNDMLVGEAFIGLHDRLEADVVYVNTRGDDTDDFTEVNLYGTLFKESVKHPSLVLGVTNVFESDFLGGSDEASWFAVSGWTLQNPEKLSWAVPMVRVHLGYGAKFHRDRAFGGVQLKFAPRFGAAALNYQSKWMFMGTYNVGKSLETSLGINDGNLFYRAGLSFGW